MNTAASPLFQANSTTEKPAFERRLSCASTGERDVDVVCLVRYVGTSPPELMISLEEILLFLLSHHVVALAVEPTGLEPFMNSSIEAEFLLVGQVVHGHDRDDVVPARRLDGKL